MNLPPNEQINKISEKTKIDNIGMNQNSELPSNQKQNNLNLYCISCFHKKIWNLYNLASINPEIISIEKIYEQILLYDKNYIIIIHKLNLNEKIKKMNLLLNSKSNPKSWNLNEIIIKLDKEKEKFLFVDLELNLNNLFEFIKDLNENSNIENNNINFDNNTKISRSLKLDEKLNLYLDYFKKNKI